MKRSMHTRQLHSLRFEEPKSGPETSGRREHGKFDAIFVSLPARYVNQKAR